MQLSRFTWGLIGFTFFCVLAAMWSAAHAQTPPFIVQHNGASQFTANCLQHDPTSPVWNFMDSCGQPPPATGRITTSNLAYVPPAGTRFTGVTEWSAIWGHASATDVEVLFPGRSNASPSIINFTRTGYIAAHFRPTGAGARFGYITHTEYNYGADLTWSISTAAGDFNPANTRCKGATLSGQVLGRWTTAPATYGAFCPVAQGVDYYLNIKLTNPAQGTTTCAANRVQCVVGTANAFGG